MQDIPWFGGNHDSTQKYPVVPFGEYLQVRNSPRAHGVTDWILSDPEEALPMVQFWLFFGVLEAAFWDSFGDSAHFKETPIAKVIDTKLLRGVKIC